jgi:hypothetical protein
MSDDRDEDGTEPGSDAAETESRVVSGRELMRMMRKKAYQRAKALRNADPRYLAMKEAAKQKRREVYQVAKEKRKAETATQKAADKKQTTARKAEERAARDGELRKLLLGGAGAGKKAAPANDVIEETATESEPSPWIVRAPVTPYDVN